ncbi:MAG TPA: methionine--tRNA ligase subunit beta [Thermofilum sp.]|nr:methionine--tRNA ligase subunit beta [Thermofilum sp.]
MSIKIDEFKRLDIRVGKVIEARKIPTSRKLLLLKVDLGNEIRQVIAGIANEYSLEELKGKEVVLLANLEPKRIMGYESQGMILAAVADNKPVLIIPDREVPPGTRVE